MLYNVQPLNQVEDVVSPRGAESVVVGTRHMHGELEGLGLGFGEAAYLGDKNVALDGLLMDIVDALVGHDEGALLGPFKHVGLLDQVREEQPLAGDQRHQSRVRHKADVVLRLERID